MASQEEPIEQLNDAAPVPMSNPVLPPRPLSPFAQKQATLSEAFPGVETKTVRAILIAAQGQLDHAFNGLLSLTDPTYVVDESQFEEATQAAPAAAGAPLPSAQRTQMEEDERLARSIASEDRRAAPRLPARTQQQQQQQQEPGEPVDERSFFDDDLPQIKETFTKGFNETKDKVNSWFDNLRKKIDSPEPAAGAATTAGAVGAQRGGRRRYYDDEPDHIDVGGIQLANEEAGEVDELYSAPRPGATPPVAATATKKSSSSESTPTLSSTGAGAKKGIPLKSSAVGKAEEEDSFLISDSDDEGVSKTK